jgi:uncharacterized OB-fold protein
MKIAAHPGLYDPDDTVPTLRGTRCGACSSTFFPPLGIGCEVCGATEDSLVPASIAPKGVLHSVATVHPRAGDNDAPFTVAEIQLDDGPLIRAMMAEVAEIDAIGRRVEAQWSLVHTDADGTDVVEPRFALTAAPDPSGGAR